MTLRAPLFHFAGNMSHDVAPAARPARRAPAAAPVVELRRPAPAAAPVADDRHLDLDDSDEADAERSEGGGYENSPACKLLATCCAICGKALVDADSVQAGIGPDCRAKYGVQAGRTGAFNEDRFWALVRAAAFESCVEVTAGDEIDAHRTANLLTHRVGRDPKGTEAAHAIAAIWALGYTKLAARLCERAGVVVTAEGHSIIVKAPYQPDFGSNLRRANAWAKFDKSDPKNKVWRAEAANKGAVWRAICATYTGKACLGPQGVVVVPAPKPEG